MSLVVVSQRVDDHPERQERRDALDQRLTAFLLAAGCLPVPVPNGLARDAGDSRTLANWLARIQPQAVVLSGGNDVGQCPSRDDTETALLAIAARDSLAVLGICRGMQMMALQAGARLQPLHGHVRSRHRLQGVINRDVNSFHHHAVTDCPDAYEVLARSEDGAIEAIRHQSLRWEGWMWHPEREATFHPDDVSRARRLLGGR